MFGIVYMSTPMASMLHAVAVLYFLSLFLSISASPIPLPLPLMAADYSLSLVSVNRSSRQFLPRRLQTLPTVPSFSSEKLARDLAGLDSLAALTQLYDNANGNAAELRSLAADSANTDNDDYNFQQQYATALSGFNTNMLGFQTLLAESTTTDKGLANYDHQNDLETLLKKVVNANKDVLSYTTTVVYNIPGIGPVLGPIVYDLKCFVDGLLDATEDLSDAIINALGPPLRALLGQASDALCKSGAEVAGLCV